MRHVLFCFMTLFIAYPAWADHFEEIVTYQCDQKHGQLKILHQGAYNEAGLALTAHLQDGQWDVRSLFTGPEGPSKTVARKCSLGNTVYKVKISGITWNKDHSDESAHVFVMKNTKELINTDLKPSSFDADGGNNFITQIIISPTQAKPEITSVSRNEFMGL